MPTKEVNVEEMSGIKTDGSNEETVTTTWTLNEEHDKHLFIKCDDNAETLVFTKYNWDYDLDHYEISIEDDFCGYSFMGIRNRFKRAWCAFWAKPIVHNAVFFKDKTRIRKFLENCIKMIDEG